jgi:hypothetical protein
MVTGVPTVPDVGVSEVMPGGRTVKLTPVLGTPPTVTTTLPVVVAGTGAVMLVGVQPVGVDVTPLKVTVLLPCVAPKFVPVMFTEAPTWPDVGFSLVMVGAGMTVKATELLATAETVTTTGPVVAAAGTGTVMLVAVHAVGDAGVPLKVTVLAP